MKTVAETLNKNESKSAAPKNGGLIFICIALAAVTFAVFSPVLSCGFINYDDQDYVYENRMVQRGVTLDGIKWAFTATYASNWHPLTWITHMIDCQLFGLKAGGHHFTNLLLHAANAILILLLFQKMTGALWRSALVAALFALHPLHVESAAWVAERKDVLSTFFGLIAILFYARYAQRLSGKGAGEKGRKGEQQNLPGSLSPFLPFYFLALLFFALSLMSKPMLVTLPFVLLLLDFWPLKRLNTFHVSRFTPLLLEKIPFLALSIASCAMTIFVQRGKTMMTLEQHPILARLGNVVVSYATYIFQMFWPAKLCIFYPLVGAPPVWKITAAVALLCAVTVLAIRFAKSHPFAITGWLWFLGTLVPVIGFVHVGEQSHADRYTYIPFVGLFVALVWSSAALAERSLTAKKILPACATILLLACAFLSWRQVGFWKSGETVLRRALAVTTGNFLAHNNLGTILAAQDKHDEAESHYREAIRIKPYYARAHSNLGTALVMKGQLEEAIACYEKALQFRPTDAQAHHNLAVTLGRLKRYDETVFHCREALRNDPNYTKAYFDLGIALRLSGKIQEAAEALALAVQFDPGDAVAQYQYAVTLGQLQRGAEAIVHYQIAIQLDSSLANSRVLEQLQQMK